MFLQTPLTQRTPALQGVVPHVPEAHVPVYAELPLAHPVHVPAQQNFALPLPTQFPLLHSIPLAQDWPLIFSFPQVPLIQVYPFD